MIACLFSDNFSFVNLSGTQKRNFYFSQRCKRTMANNGIEILCKGHWRSMELTLIGRHTNVDNTNISHGFSVWVCIKELGKGEKGCGSFYLFASVILFPVTQEMFVKFREFSLTCCRHILFMQILHRLRGNWHLAFVCVRAYLCMSIGVSVCVEKRNKWISFMCFFLHTRFYLAQNNVETRKPPKEEVNIVPPVISVSCLCA